MVAEAGPPLTWGLIQSLYLKAVPRGFLYWQPALELLSLTTSESTSTQGKEAAGEGKLPKTFILLHEGLLHTSASSTLCGFLYPCGDAPMPGLHGPSLRILYLVQYKILLKMRYPTPQGCRDKAAVSSTPKLNTAPTSQPVVFELSTCLFT